MNTNSRGVSLVIVLLLMAGVMLLAVSGLGGAIASMAMADLDERAARAFEAAEAGVARTLDSGTAVWPAAAPWPSTDPAVTVRTVIRHDPPPQAPAWTHGFSFGTGGGGFVLHHGSILAEGSAGRGTLVRIEQGFAVVGPARESAP
jgi:hypothetical protein